MAPNDLRKLEAENRELKRAVDELILLNDLASQISASTDFKQIIDTIVHRARGIVGAHHCEIKMIDPPSQNDMMRTLVRTSTTKYLLQKYSFDQSLIGWIQIHHTPLMVNDPVHDERFHGVEWDPSIKNVLLVPLLVKSQLIAVLTLFNKTDGKEFTLDDQRILSIIALQSAQVIENARLLEEEKQLIELRRDMETANKIQRGLIPKEPMNISGYNLHGEMEPAVIVGGDYFDYFLLDDDHIGFVIADATGHGVSSAYFMAICRTLLRAHAPLFKPPEACMRKLNFELSKDNAQQMHTSMIYGILNIQTGKITYCNCGHPPPMILRADGSLEYEPIMRNALLCAADDTEYHDREIHLSHGDRLILFTDGITETALSSEMQFGVRRFGAFLQDRFDSNPKDLFDELKNELRSFSRKKEFEDDCTLLIISRNS